MNLTTADLKALHDHCLQKAAMILAIKDPLVTEGLRRKKVAKELQLKALEIDNILMAQIDTLKFNDPTQANGPNRSTRRMKVTK